MLFFNYNLDYSLTLDLHLGAECDHQFAFIILATLTTGWGVPQASKGTSCWHGREDFIFISSCTFLKKKKLKRKKRKKKNNLTGIP